MATGAIPGFDSEGFREGIRLAMNVGLPVDPADQPLFVFAATVANAAPADDEDVPYDSAARPVVAVPLAVKVPCAIEYVDAAGKVENFGVIVPSKVRLTLLDQEYEQIKGFRFVVIGGDRFFYTKTEPPVGMVDVAVWTVHATAEDDS